MEPIITGGGILMPHDGYMEVKKICEKHEAHLICDEEICGFGRTGQ